MTNHSSNSSDIAGEAEPCGLGAADHLQPLACSQVTDQLPSLLTVKEFLWRFRIGCTSFYNEVNSGRLKIVKFGKATRIRRTDAEAWFNALPSPALGPRPLAPPSGKPRKGSKTS